MSASSIYSSESSTHSSSQSHASQPRNQPKQRQKQTFPIAYPPPLKTPHCLRRFTPNLLLQIQQLSTSTTSNKRRHIPVLEVWQPSIFNTRVAKKVPRLGSRDVYVTQCEGFLHLRADGEGRNADAGAGAGKGEGDDDAEVGRGVVSVVSRDSRNTQEEKSVVYFADGVGWEAGVSSGTYRVSFRDKVLVWEREPGQGEQFVLRIADQRRVRIAKMSRTSIEVDSCSRRVREYLRDGLVSDSGPGTGREELDGRLCTLILTSGVWVAAQEGWIST